MIHVPSILLREQVVRKQPQVLAPNVGTWGNEYHHDSIRQAVDHVDETLRDAQLDLYVKRGVMGFQYDTIHANSNREGFHTFWVCLSILRKPDSHELRSHWILSNMVKRMFVPEVPMSPVINYFDPTKGNFSRADTSGRSLGDKQKARLALSGQGVMDAIRRMLFSGMNFTQSTRAAWIDTTAFFTDGPASIMACRNVQYPTEMYIMPIVLDVGVPGGNQENTNESIFKYIIFKGCLNLGSSK